MNRLQDEQAPVKPERIASGPLVEDTLLEYDDDALAEMVYGFGLEAERLGRLARGAHAELRARMIERGATKLDTEHWEGTMKPGAITHTVDDAYTLRTRLFPLLCPDDLQFAFPEPPPPVIRISHVGLNELHKRGGEIAAIIDQERRSVRGEDQLVLKRKLGGPL